jgi:hypothetical protein
MAGHNHEFQKSEKQIFFALGLDSESRLETAGEFRFSEQAILALKWPPHKRPTGKIAQLICPSGKSVCLECTTLS